VVDVVQNFFIARTQTAGSIRMDPQFARKGHREWFIDAIGKLRIARYDFERVRISSTFYVLRPIDFTST